MEGKPLLLFHFALVPLQKRNRGGLPFCARTLGAEDGRGPTSLLKFLDQEERKPGKEHRHIHVWRCESREAMDVAAWPIIMRFPEPDKKPPTMERFAPYMLKVFQREPTSTQERILRETTKKGEGNCLCELGVEILGRVIAATLG